MDERDPASLRIEWRRGSVRLSVELHLATVGSHRPCEHVHERALSGPVLADQRVYLSRRDNEIDTIQRHSGSEALGHAGDTQARLFARRAARGPDFALRHRPARYFSTGGVTSSFTR